MADIHTRNGVAYVSSAHTEEEILDAGKQTQYFYVDARQMGLDDAIQEAKRIKDLCGKKYYQFDTAVVGIQGDAHSFNGEGTKIGAAGLTAVTEHFDDYEKRVGLDADTVQQLIAERLKQGKLVR